MEAGGSGIRTVKAFANEQDAMDKFRTSNEKFKKVKKNYYRIFGVFNASTEFAMAFLYLDNRSCENGGGANAGKPR